MPTLPATPHVTESELLHGYRVRVERCACGGAIVAHEGDWENIAAAVRIHNLTPSHQEWRARRCRCWGDSE